MGPEPGSGQLVEGGGAQNRLLLQTLPPRRRSRPFASRTSAGFQACRHASTYARDQA